MPKNEEIKYLTEPYSNEEIYNSLNPIVRLWYKLKFKDPSPPQKYSIITILKKENSLISSPTGSGKTLSAFLSILSELITYQSNYILEKKVYAIYISPLKALANDIEKNLTRPLNEMNQLLQLSKEEIIKITKTKKTITKQDLEEFFTEKKKIKKISLKIAIRTGDTSQYEKSKMLKTPPHILITTPESFSIILASKKFIDHLLNLEWVVIDEIHALADNKRGTHLSLSLELLNHYSNFTRIGLSATVSPLEEVAKYLVGLEKNEYNKYGEKIKKYRKCNIIDVQYLKQINIKVLTPVKNLIKTSSEELTRKLYQLIHQLIQNKKITLIFTNTRAGTERVVYQLKTLFPNHYNDENIGAHHGSLSKDERHEIEKKLKDGKIKVVISSTSLELGIDIGNIDQVILLGSPKSVARTLQRVGRAGHKLHEISYGRIIPLDRDDLVEVSTILKDALEKHIDNIKITKNALDVLAQQIFGFIIQSPKTIDELKDIVYKSYCYADLAPGDFLRTIEYLEGKYENLEDKNVYGKIRWFRDTNILRPRGKLSRTIYLTNIGTIPEQTGIKVKIGKKTIGILDENFLERLKKGDIFTLGGKTYKFLHSRGMSIQVTEAPGQIPTIPNWYSEQLPLSFELALSIQQLRKKLNDIFKEHGLKDEKKEKTTKQIAIKFLKEYLYVDENTANSIYEYHKEQYLYLAIPHIKRLIIEIYDDVKSWKRYLIFHSMYGRRVNDVLSRATAYIVGKQHHRDTEVLITDNGYAIIIDYDIRPNIERIVNTLKISNLKKILKNSLENSEVLRRRFRHCATRGLLILKSYKGRKKNVGRQQINSMFLLKTVKELGEDFPILKETYREILEDFMDINNAQKIIESIRKGDIRIDTFYTEIPSPFAFNLVLQGNLDIIKMESRQEFLQRYHNMVLAKIELEKNSKK